MKKNRPKGRVSNQVNCGREWLEGGIIYTDPILTIDLINSFTESELDQDPVFKDTVNDLRKFLEISEKNQAI
jgi:hypothetical protein